MGTEEELRERVARAIYALRYNGDGCLSYADAAIKVLGLTWKEAAWITANPEAAKGLASGEMVAVERTTRALITTAYNLGQDNAAASPPAPSGKAQGET